MFTDRPFLDGLSLREYVRGVSEFDVHQHGEDSCGRKLFTTDYMWSVHQAVLACSEVAPFAEKVVIVQGAFMVRAGGGAKASNGYHDAGGCLDYRTWNLTDDESEAFVRAWRSRGGAAWRRDNALLHGGMDEHCHVTLGSDSPLSDGAKESWQQYLDGDNGLSGNSHGRDYERRPVPLVTEYKPEEDDMQLTDKLGAGDDSATVQDALRAALHTQKALFAFRKNMAARDAVIVDMLTELQNGVEDAPSKAQLKRISTLLKQEMADGPT